MVRLCSGGSGISTTRRGGASSRARHRQNRARSGCRHIGKTQVDTPELPELPQLRTTGEVGQWSVGDDHQEIPVVVLDFMGHDPTNFVDSERALLWMIKSHPCGV